MTDLQRLCAELAGMAKRTERHADVFEAFALEPIAVKVPRCGTCGDSGRIPNEGPLRWSDPRFDEDDELECPDCPICRECGVELRRHLTEECP